MDSSPKASSSIVAAGVVAIILGALGAFSNLAVLLLFSSARLASTAPFPAALRPVIYGVWIFFLLCGVFVMVSGIQAIRLRNWARISLLIIAGCFLFFGLVGIVVIFVTIYATPMPDPTVSKALLAAVLGMIYGIPILIAFWWLILFTRPSVTAQFQNFAAHSAPSVSNPASSALAMFNNPACPLPVRIVGWYLASFVFLVPFLPFLPIHLPAYFFGQIFRGPAANGIYFLSFVLLIVPGFGLLLLKRWSYPLTYVSQLLLCANGIFSTFSSSYEATMRAMLSEMNLPNLAPGADQMLHYGRYFGAFGLVVPVAILVTLFVCQRKFYEAVNRSGPAAPTAHL